MDAAFEIELPEVCSDVAVRKALAVQLGVEAFTLVLAADPCGKAQRRAKRMITFAIVGKSSELAGLQARISKMGAVTFGGVQTKGPQILELEVWEQLGGIYYLRQCPPGNLLINTTIDMQECKQCLPSTYLLEGSSECTKCPEGADCPDGISFVSRVEGAQWTEELATDGTGTRRLRITECPAGYALVRRESNPQADLCFECPGSSDFGYSLQPAIWTGLKSKTDLEDFCLPCPTPATSVKCEGGTKVTSLGDWWIEQQVAEVDDEDIMVDQGTNQSRRTGQSMVYRSYQCDPNQCLGNNTCANERSGPACSRCPSNFALEAGVCTECPDASPEETTRLRIIFGFFTVVVFCFVWFMLSWAPVFGTTAKKIVMDWFEFPLRIFRTGKQLAVRAEKLDKSRQAVQGFLADPKNMKLFQQYLKIFIAYVQVLGSFIVFKVKWPSGLQSGITWVNNVSGMIKFDIMEIPRLACVWATFGYANKFYVTMSIPLIVCLLLAIPVVVVWLLLPKKDKADSERREEGSQDLEKQEGKSSTDLLHLKWVKISDSDASIPGLKWEDAGATQPISKNRLANPALENALLSRTEFTQEEWHAFGIEISTCNVYIQSGASYFTPTSGGTIIKNGGLEMALRSKKLVFTQAEFEKFGFLDLPINVYIRVDDQYFKPAVTANWNKRFEATVDVYWNNLVRHALLS